MQKINVRRTFIFLPYILTNVIICDIYLLSVRQMHFLHLKNSGDSAEKFSIYGDDFMYYNRKSIRLKKYDYSQNGMYFITICAKNRKPLLSKIIVNTVGARGYLVP